MEILCSLVFASSLGYDDHRKQASKNTLKCQLHKYTASCYSDMQHTIARSSNSAALCPVTSSSRQARYLGFISCVCSACYRTTVFVLVSFLPRFQSKINYVSSVCERPFSLVKCYKSDGGVGPSNTTELSRVFYWFCDDML
jgi:hypothetical protein